MGGVISGSISLLRSVYMAGDLASMTAGGTVRGYMHTRLFLACSTSNLVRGWPHFAF